MTKKKEKKLNKNRTFLKLSGLTLKTENESNN